MKNKPTVYILLSAVVLIWGLIGYRVYSAITTPDDTVPISPMKSVRETFNDYSLPQDTGKLLLNYHDPFGQVAPKDTARSEKVAIVRAAKPATAVTPFSWAFINYSGYLRDPATKKLVAFLTINGKGVTMAEGETMDNVRLLKNFRDSVKISFNGRTKYLALHARTL